ncbi:MAG TPA: MarR family transcriptional regulator [Desulfitobacteriaceae bacterium]|nr:MarR family transcriptional regulator [Desulfitobacteriaceae bacterium]
MDMSNTEKIYQIIQKFHKIGINKKTTGEMPRSELMMLKMIKMNSSETEGVTITALSELLEISKSAVSQTINALEDKAYVERITIKNDRRLVYVRLTESGQQCLAKELQSFLEGMAQTFARMGERDTEDLLRLLEKLYLIISDYSHN